MKVDRACSLDWLIILTTGRAGSTTILNMLNAIPQIAITGELNADHPRFPGHSGHVLRLLFDVLDASTSATVVGLPGDPSYAAPQVPRLRQHMCGWIRDMLPPDRSDLPRYHGFKALLQHVPNFNRTVELFGEGSIRVVRNYRIDLEAQARSMMLSKVFSPDVTLADALARVQRDTSRLHAMTAGVRSFDLPLERFNTHHFNNLLAFLDIRNCSFSRVLRSNANGTFGDSLDASRRGLVKGECARASRQKVAGGTARRRRRRS